MRKISIAVMFTVFAMLIASCQTVKYSSVNYGRENVVVLNLNAYYDAPQTKWDSRKEHLASLITDEDPDIITLQEIMSTTETEILMETRQKVFLEQFSEYNIIGTYSNYIMYKTARFFVMDFGMFWFNEMPGQNSLSWGERLPRNTVWAEFKDLQTGITFRVYTLHLDYGSAQTRRESVEILLEKVPENIPVLVTGDFNTHALSIPIRQMETRFNDLLAGLGGTHPFLGFLPLRIDYIFATEEFSLVEGKVLPTPASDHNALIARIQIRR